MIPPFSTNVAEHIHAFLADAAFVFGRRGRSPGPLLAAGRRLLGRSPARSIPAGAPVGAPAVAPPGAPAGLPPLGPAEAPPVVPMIVLALSLAKMMTS